MGSKAFLADFDGDGKTDVLVFRPSDGYVGKWYSDTPRSSVFDYQTAQYIGGSPGAFSGAQLLVGDFDGDGIDDVLVFRPSDGYVGKWYSDRARSPVFDYQTAQYIGGSPGAFSGAQLLVGDFDGDGIDDVLVFRPSDGYVGKWYSDRARSPIFDYRSAISAGIRYAELHVGDFDGDGIDDILLFRPGDGVFNKWYSDTARSTDFIHESLEAIGGSFGSFRGAQVISAAPRSTYTTPDVTPPPPIITGFAPEHGLVGTTVTIVGRNIFPVLWGVEKTRVEFGGTQAQITLLADEALKAIVPGGAVTARITYIERYAKLSGVILLHPF
jgi:hypothetical protein